MAWKSLLSGWRLEVGDKLQITSQFNGSYADFLLPAWPAHVQLATVIHAFLWNVLSCPIFLRTCWAYHFLKFLSFIISKDYLTKEKCNSSQVNVCKHKRTGNNLEICSIISALVILLLHLGLIIAAMYYWSLKSTSYSIWRLAADLLGFISLISIVYFPFLKPGSNTYLYEIFFESYVVMSILSVGIYPVTLFIICWFFGRGIGRIINIMKN